MTRIGLVLILALAAWADSDAGRALPLEIEAAEDVSARFAGAPRLHSFVSAVWDGKWIFIAGRTAGYHGVGAKDADFPRVGSNDRVWVVDPSSNPARVYSAPLSTLPASLAAVRDQWMSSNLEFAVERDTLYLAGGYGENTAGAWVTYPILSAVHLPTLVNAVMKGSLAAAGIRFTESTAVQVTGGEMVRLGDGVFYLIGGHVFTGTYRDFEAAEEKSTAQASQTYTGEIRKLRIERAASGSLKLAVLATYADPEFNRRDLNAGLTILSDGSLGAAAYGGVFTKDQLAFVNPIYWGGDSAPKVDQSYSQKMSAYTCARLAFYDPESKRMLTTFFGGIGGWSWNPSKNSFVAAARVGDRSAPVYFDGLQWSDQITTLVREGAASYELVQPRNRLAGHIGSNAVFLPASDLPRVRPDADVFDLRALRGKRVLAGYIYGGIRAFPKQFPYREDSPDYQSGNVPTRASELIVAVYVTVPRGK